MKLYREIIHPIRIPFNRRKSTSISFVQTGFELLPLPSRLSAPKTERSVIRSRLPPLECLLNNPLISIVTHVKRGGERERESFRPPPETILPEWELAFSSCKQKEKKKNRLINHSRERGEKKRRKKTQAAKYQTEKAEKGSRISVGKLSLSLFPPSAFSNYTKEPTDRTPIFNLTLCHGPNTIRIHTRA